MNYYIIIELWYTLSKYYQLLYELVLIDKGEIPALSLMFDLGALYNLTETLQY